MLKKLTLLAMSVGALLALAVPAAQATGPLITNANGQAAKTLSGTSTNTRVTTAVGTFECTTVILNGTIVTNADTTARGQGTGEAKGTPGAGEPARHSGHCSSGSGPIVEVTNITISDAHATKHDGETTGTGTFSFTYDLRSATGAGLIAECTFGGTLSGKQTGPSTGNINGEIVKTAGSAFCPTVGTISGDFTVTADGLGPATVH